MIEQITQHIHKTVAYCSAFNFVSSKKLVSVGLPLNELEMVLGPSDRGVRSSLDESSVFIQSHLKTMASSGGFLWLYLNHIQGDTHTLPSVVDLFGNEEGGVPYDVFYDTLQFFQQQTYTEKDKEKHLNVLSQMNTLQQEACLAHSFSFTQDMLDQCCLRDDAKRQLLWGALSKKHSDDSHLLYSSDLFPDLGQAYLMTGVDEQSPIVSRILSQGCVDPELTFLCLEQMNGMGVYPSQPLPKEMAQNGVRALMKKSNFGRDVYRKVSVIQKMQPDDYEAGLLMALQEASWQNFPEKHFMLFLDNISFLTRQSDKSFTQQVVDCVFEKSSLDQRNMIERHILEKKGDFWRLCEKGVILSYIDPVQLSLNLKQSPSDKQSPSPSKKM